MVVDGIELAARLPGVDVAAVVAPAGGLGIEGCRDGVVETVPEFDRTLRTEGTVFSQDFLGPAQVSAGELFILQQVMEDAGGVAVAVVLAA